MRCFKAGDTRYYSVSPALVVEERRNGIIRQGGFSLKQFHRAVALSAAAFIVVLAFAASASAAPTWAPAASASIHPGVQVFTDGAQCTANFVYYDASNVY